ncbi:D-alanyl-D-alanine carboxypeptidase family protein [Geodermatophilus sp. SYSU D00703]
MSGSPNERRPHRGLADALADVLPPVAAAAAGGLGPLVRLLETALAPAAVQLLVTAGLRDENTLTNVVFWARHPGMAGDAIDPGRQDLVREWLLARDTVVRPALRSARSRPAQSPSPSGAASDRVPEGAMTGQRLGQFGTEAESDFRRRVYDAQLARSLQRGREFFPGLPVADLAEVEGGHRLHVSAAADCRALLARARSDLEAAQSAGERGAVAVRTISIRSAYRDPERDFSAWQNAFDTHYRRTGDERAALAEGPLGPAAVRLMVQRMALVKAVPGFSNHTRGLAVDLGTREGGVDYGPSSAQSAAWRRTWLYAWLVANAGAFHFRPYAAEPWHWDHE